MAGFDILNNVGDTMGDTKIIQYRNIRVNTTGKKWFVEFTHLVPVSLRPHYGNRKWLRIKVYKDINVVKTLEYACQVRTMLEQWLKDGFSPFEYDMEGLRTVEEAEGGKKEMSWTIQQAVLYFLQKWRSRGLEQTSLVKYERTVQRFIAWLTARGLQHADAKVITSEHVEAYLYDSKQAAGWTNNTFNGERGFIGTIFEFLSKKRIAFKPEPIEKLKSSPKKHKYYDDRTFLRLKTVLMQKDPYTFFACQVVYYLCLRSSKELLNFKVGNIFPDRRQVLITDGKTGDRFVPMSQEMLDIFTQRKILECPGDYYVFSVSKKNSYAPDGTPGPDPVGKDFFSKRFSKRRKEIGITQDYTIYGMKHTRVVHLKNDGARDSDIMSLTGHTSFEAYAKYLRDLGMTANEQDIHKLTRKI